MVLASSVAVLGLRMRTSPSGTAPASEGDHGEAQLRRTGRAARPVPFTNATPATEFQGLGSSETYAGTTYFWTPGEPVIAVGPNDIVQTVNEAAAV
jgi:hypothetical protein